MYSSFVCEHTVEFVLIPRIIQELSEYYDKITPVYYWASREGGLLARQSFGSTSLKVLVLYPRRPKIVYRVTSSIFVNINQLVVDRARYFSSHGIPVIAGFPLASRLEEMTFRTSCGWISIDEKSREEVLEFNLNEGLLVPCQSKSITVSEIAELLRCAPSFSWPDVVSLIKAMGRDESFTFFNRMSGDLYKPIYLLVHCE